MKIITMEVGDLGTNCYIVYCEETRQAAVIDPGGNAKDIIAGINGEGLAVACVINTHGHADHIAANQEICQLFKAPIYIHSADAPMLTNAQMNLSVFIGSGFTCQAAERLLQDGDIIEVGTLQLKVLHTPGHTPGGICLYGYGILFSGDTLFAESVGRTDFPGGSYSQLLKSIKEKLFILDGETKVLPGHGGTTTVEWERKMNPFVTDALFD